MAGLKIINSGLAEDPRFETDVRAKLNAQFHPTAKNNATCHISAGLDESDEVPESSLALVSAYFNREP